ncbi:MAG: hypothetical protein WCK62_02700 [Actinomycetes bacterium]|jgi:dipeptidase
MNLAATSSTAFSALIWWAVPIVAVLGALSYVLWVSRFQDKFDNQTNRSVSKFQDFQESFRDTKSVIADGSIDRSIDEPTGESK